MIKLNESKSDTLRLLYKSGHGAARLLPFEGVVRDDWGWVRICKKSGYCQACLMRKKCKVGKE
jgi:hypothetical protein